MEREVKEAREREIEPGPPRDESIFFNMQCDQQLDSDRRRLWLENLPGMYNMSCTQLLALANTIGTSSSLGASSSQFSIDSWINSWKTESNPWILNPAGSSLGINTGISAERRLESPQYDVLTPQKFICDLNLTPEEMVSTRSQLTKPELDTPGKTLPKTDLEPQHPTKKSVGELGSPSKEKRGKRARDDEKAQLKTPKQIVKRKKVRPRVVSEGKTSKPGFKKSSAAKTSESTSYVRPKRSSRRSLSFDYDLQEEDEGLRFTSDGLIGISSYGKEGTTLQIPKRRRKTNDCLNSIMSAGLMESEEKDHKKLRRKRSRTVTRPRNLGSLKTVLEGIIQIKRDRKGYEVPIVSQMQSTMSRKKRSQRDPIASQINARVLNMQWRRHNSTVMSTDEQWEHRLSVKAITKLFKELDINRESPCLPQNRETTLLLHKKACQEQKAIVQYMIDAKKHPPKVLLDDETTRVWKLLLLSIDSAGVDGADEDKQKWWREERNMFHGRANSFIACMRLVQGDRRFSLWKGSVVDSVVGVFLTQNVADHSSSSVFMDIAAEFPINLNSNKEQGSSVTHEALINLDPGNVAATPRISNPNCIIIQEIDDDEDTDDVSQETAKTSKTSDSSISSTNQSKMMLLNLPTVSFETHFGSEARETVDCDEEAKERACSHLGMNGFSQGISIVSSTSTYCELNLNEVPLEVEKCDALINKVDEDSQVQPMCSHQQEVESTTEAQDQEKNTRTEHHRKNSKKPTSSRSVGRQAKKKLTEKFAWGCSKNQAENGGQKSERTEITMDTVDWEAVRCADVNKIADLIRKRGMNNMLSERIKAFLNRLFLDHGSIDLEWLRDVHPDKAKEYLLSINGLGLKSVECVRLLSLHQIAFPVDTNVGRIAVRLGWVPLQPLPDELQMHLLELYPVLDSVQKYLWPRLCKLDQKTLYELHYHMITFGKVFCTKKNPNCNACPMKAECRHYSSAYASARLALPEPEETPTVIAHERRYKSKHVVVTFRPSLFLSQEKEQVVQRSQNCEPIIEEPTTPQPEYIEHDIEDYPWDNKVEGGTSKDPWDENHTIMLNKEVGTSKDLVVINTKGTSIPRHNMKIREKLRTAHLVYELPDHHYLLQGFERRESKDVVPYMLAIWTPGETPNSIQPPEQRCVSQESNTLCQEKKCFFCNNIREEKSQIVRGTILIPCRTAMRGGFPLNGTYFQTNEVFADHGSSIKPIDVPRECLENLPKRITYFGSSVTAICRGLSLEAIGYGFQEGYVCVRGFDRENRKSQTLVKRLHCPPSKQSKEDEE